METEKRARTRAVASVGVATAAAAAASGAAIAVAATPSGGATASGGATPVHDSSNGRAVKVKVRAERDVLANTDDRVRGSLSEHLAHETVIVEAHRRHGWQQVAQTHTGRRGRFSATWAPNDVGRYAVRARLADGTATGKAKGKVTAYKESNVSWYGPGFYGHSTACGGTLSRDTLGVANKTLPCGTRVALRYNGRSVTVPVIDRGPYVSGREYDLTEATRDRIQAPSTGTIWTAPLP